MANYAVFFSFTDQGIRNIKESPARVRSAKRIFQEQGADVTAFYAIAGQQWDTIFIVEAPSDDAVMKGALAVSSMGNVRTTTARLYDEDEFRGLVGALP